MRFDYGTQNSPFPIALSIGTLVKPKLKDIADPDNGMSFDKFNYYEVLVKMTPESFYTKLKGDEGKKYWKTLSDDEQLELTLYRIVVSDESLLNTFVEIFNFFFKETVIFQDGYFILLNESADKDIDITSPSQSDIRGVISENTFSQVLDAIQQVCCISDKDEEVDEKKFKSKRARRMYEKMQRAAQKERERKKSDINFTLPNIISVVSNNHPSINPINVWELNIFQLYDAFNRLQMNAIYNIDSTRVSVWGDEKKTFDAALWYKNEYDKSGQP